MLTRREILRMLREFGITGLAELKKSCRDYERYFRGSFYNKLARQTGGYFIA